VKGKGCYVEPGGIRLFKNDNVVAGHVMTDHGGYSTPSLRDLRHKAHPLFRKSVKFSASVVL